MRSAISRGGLPDDIGPMIASLLSEDNRRVNAQRIECPAAEESDKASDRDDGSRARET
jgi:hypothetical protein